MVASQTPTTSLELVGRLGGVGGGWGTEVGGGVGLGGGGGGGARQTPTASLGLMWVREGDVEDAPHDNDHIPGGGRGSWEKEGDGEGWRWVGWG